MNELVKTITVTNDTMLVSLAVVSKVWLDTLPPDLQKIVDRHRRTRCRRKAQAWEIDFTKQLDADWVDARRHGAHAAGGRSRGR